MATALVQCKRDRFRGVGDRFMVGLRATTPVYSMVDSLLGCICGLRGETAASVQCKRDRFEGEGGRFVVVRGATTPVWLKRGRFMIGVGCTTPVQCKKDRFEFGGGGFSVHVRG